MKATQRLEQQHHTIERVATACGVFSEMLQNGDSIPPAVLQNTVEFLRVYGDQYHHEEEEWLFSMLAAKGIPSGSCPIAVLTHEDHKLAGLVDQLEAAVGVYAKGDNSGNGTLVSTLGALAELYPDHIWKEDYLLLPMADKLFSEHDQQILSDTLAMIESGKGVAARQAVEKLSAALKSCSRCNPTQKHSVA